MAAFVKERDRLLATTAGTTGIASAVVATILVALPGALPLKAFLPVLVCLIAMTLFYTRVGLPRPLVWLVGIQLAGLAAMASLAITGAEANLASESALAVIAGGAVAPTAMLLTSPANRVALLVVAFAVEVGALAVTLRTMDAPVARPALLAVVGWTASVLLGFWIGRVVPRTMRRIAAVSAAYRAERAASETEARRRQGARMLHDTVLATLTLLAHSGVGVGTDALREQASEDAALLRQLRMGFTPTPAASGDYKLKPVRETTLGNTLESVKQRFARMGLEVTWHGIGHVFLPADVLDGFLGALGECLENVRRHSGVDEAHVTITDDDTTVRAMVTDQGVGFDLESIPEGHLGFKESVIARLRDAGGNARLFSTPGAGTTVVLEVPK